VQSLIYICLRTCSFQHLRVQSLIYICLRTCSFQHLRVQSLIYICLRPCCFRICACKAQLISFWNPVVSSISTSKSTPLNISRVIQDRIYALYTTVYLVVSLPDVPYIHCIHMVLANPEYNPKMSHSMSSSHHHPPDPWLSALTHYVTPLMKTCSHYHLSPDPLRHPTHESLQPLPSQP